MNIKKCSNPMNINGIEEWMAQFFIDPFTSLLDEHTFRVDLFETSEHFIIEAELGEKIKKNDIQVIASNEKVTISLRPDSSKKSEHSSEIITRTIILPYNIEKKEMIASLNNGILEINISKHTQATKRRKFIQINC